MPKKNLLRILTPDRAARTFKVHVSLAFAPQRREDLSTHPWQK